ncbi:MAG: ATP-binding cassette domain-containing protein [Alphaproteobacteria bacterium]
MAPEPLVALSGIDVSFGRDRVLDGVELVVFEGEIVTVVGPNGAGKTTLVRVVLGLLRPGAGTVFSRPGVRVGYMPQRLTIDDTLPLTVRRFLSLSGSVPKGRRAVVLEEVGVGRLLDQPVQRISGGEMQRVLLARALLRDPELLVLDEPAQSVDVSGQSEIYSLIGALRHRRGCAVLLVSHDLHLVMAAADRVVCLNRHVCCTGIPQEVREDPAYLALFPTYAGEGLAVYAHDHDHTHDPSGEVMPLEQETAPVELERRDG